MKPKVVTHFLWAGREQGGTGGGPGKMIRQKKGKLCRIEGKAADWGKRYPRPRASSKEEGGGVWEGSSIGGGKVVRKGVGKRAAMLSGNCGTTIALGPALG